MSESVSTVPIYDPSNPYPVLNPNAEPYVVTGDVALVPSYDLMISNDPAIAPPEPEGEARKKDKSTTKEDLPPPKPREPRRGFFSR